MQEAVQPEPVAAQGRADYGTSHPRPAFRQDGGQSSRPSVNRLTLDATNLPDSCRYCRPDKPRQEGVYAAATFAFERAVHEPYHYRTNQEFGAVFGTTGTPRSYIG